MPKQVRVGGSARTLRVLRQVQPHPQVQELEAPELTSARQQIVAQARKYAQDEVPYGARAGQMVCTDVYVFAARDAGIPLIESMNEHYVGHGRGVYARSDLRWAPGVRQIKLVVDAVLGRGFNNQPGNVFFQRRLQNVMAFMASNGTLWDKQEVEAGNFPAKEGMLVFWSPKKPGLLKSSFPTHVGVATKVGATGEIEEVVQASFSEKKVIVCPHSRVLASMDLVAVGDLPASVLGK